MKKQILISFIMIIIIFLTGCNQVENRIESVKDHIIGIWASSEVYNSSIRNITYIFDYENVGKVNVSYIGETFETDLQWNIINDQLVIDVTEPETSRLINYYEFSNDYNTLTLTDNSGNIMVFNKFKTT